MKRGRKYQSSGEEYSVKKGKGKPCRLPYDNKDAGKNIKLGKKRRRGLKIWEENQDKDMGMGKNIKLQVTLCTSYCNYCPGLV